MDDREALRDVVAAYASALDRRDFDAAALLFAPDGRLTHRGRVTEGRDGLAHAFAALARYDVTTHFIGQQTVDVEGDRATGETYCLAHHVDADGNRVMSIRYQDEFVRADDAWLIAARELIVDWEEQRPR